MKRIGITGAIGNLGLKLLEHLVGLPDVSNIIGMDLRQPSKEQLAELQKLRGIDKAEFVACDLTDANDRRWRNAVSECDALVHFAAKHPFPEASWNDATTSLDMTLNVGLAAVEAGLERFIFVSSNHVMGGYLNEPLASQIGPGQLTTDLAPSPGTHWNTGTRMMDSTAYATAKSGGERFCRALAQRSAGKTAFVCTRVGWCQPGDNRPSTLSAAGAITLQTKTSDDPAIATADRWFKNMWLSNRDFDQLFQKALFADRSRWPDDFIVVNGMSDNAGMKWSLKEGLEYLGYSPVDNVWNG